MRVNCVIHAVVQPVLNVRVYSDHCQHQELSLNTLQNNGISLVVSWRLGYESLNIHHNNGISLVVSIWLGYESQLCYPVMQPEEDVKSDHCQH
jgi:hypothetical protein